MGCQTYEREKEINEKVREHKSKSWPMDKVVKKKMK